MSTLAIIQLVSVLIGIGLLSITAKGLDYLDDLNLTTEQYDKMLAGLGRILVGMLLLGLLISTQFLFVLKDSLGDFS